MNFSTPLSLFLTILLIFISLAISQAAGPKLYENVCKDASNKQRCLKLLESNSEITSAKDYLTLCRAYLKMAIDKSTKAQNYVKNLMTKYPSSTAINECASNYNVLVIQFKGSLQELVEDPMSANYDAKVAGDEPERCGRFLADEKKVDISSISALNNEMLFLSFVGFLATDHLVN
jgi:pectinesterase inhibitor-like protein